MYIPQENKFTQSYVKANFPPLYIIRMEAE